VGTIASIQRANPSAWAGSTVTACDLNATNVSVRCKGISSDAKGKRPQRPGSARSGTIHPSEGSESAGRDPDQGSLSVTKRQRGFSVSL